MLIPSASAFTCQCCWGGKKQPCYANMLRTVAASGARSAALRPDDRLENGIRRPSIWSGGTPSRSSRPPLPFPHSILDQLP